MKHLKIFKTQAEFISETLELPNVSFIEETKSVNFVPKKISDPFNGHEYVDLGLPSGTLWATCNIGAATPEEKGDCFNWGETLPRTQSYEDVCVTQGLSIDELKSRGIIGDSCNLTAEYDAATVNWGGSWRMPTISEIQELLDNCSWQLIYDPHILQKLVGPNGNFIIIPGTGIHDYDGNGYYWSSDVSGYDSQAYELFSSPIYKYTQSVPRIRETAIRPVIKI